MCNQVNKIRSYGDANDAKLNSMAQEVLLILMPEYQFEQLRKTPFIKLVSLNFHKLKECELLKVKQCLKIMVNVYLDNPMYKDTELISSLEKIKCEYINKFEETNLPRGKRTHYIFTDDNVPADNPVQVYTDELDSYFNKILDLCTDEIKNELNKQAKKILSINDSSNNTFELVSSIAKQVNNILGDEIIAINEISTEIDLDCCIVSTASEATLVITTEKNSKDNFWDRLKLWDLHCFISDKELFNYIAQCKDAIITIIENASICFYNQANDFIYPIQKYISDMFNQLIAYYEEDQNNEK